MFQRRCDLDLQRVAERRHLRLLTCHGHRQRRRRHLDTDDQHHRRHGMLASPAGSYTVVITATSGSVADTVNFALTIT